MERTIDIVVENCKIRYNTANKKFEIQDWQDISANDVFEKLRRAKISVNTSRIAQYCLDHHDGLQ